MSDWGLEIYDEAGNTIFSTEDRLTRLLQHITVSGTGAAVDYTDVYLGFVDADDVVSFNFPLNEGAVPYSITGYGSSAHGDGTRSADFTLEAAAASTVNGIKTFPTGNSTLHILAVS